ncbi:uncharacterized protein LOC143300218 [Babylonia areolata]|uniref:uncharacterized protein LOC143300218 n=1 Tax=Babylonia areolata TaxID=304850 RepID=UPI003FD098ED
MADYDDNEDHGASPVTEALAESDDVRRIKEEWTRLQMAANGGEMSFDTEPDAGGAAPQQGGGGKKPPSRLPSLDNMVGRIPSIPSMEISSSLGKKLPELGSVGHRLGILADSKELEPQPVTLEKTSYTFGAGTPTQTDVKWTPPPNHAQFKSLSYNIEVDGGQGWVPLTDNSLPILRVYFTSNKIIMGRFSKVQEAEPVAVRLRVRATGVIKTRTQEESISSPWSDEIWLSIEGSAITSNTAV